MATAYERLTSYEQWMVCSNLDTIRKTGVTVAEHVATLRANGYDRVADGVEERAKLPALDSDEARRRYDGRR